MPGKVVNSYPQSAELRSNKRQRFPQVYFVIISDATYNRKWKSCKCFFLVEKKGTQLQRIPLFIEIGYPWIRISRKLPTLPCLMG